MFGYATDETPEAMPLTCLLAHRLNEKMAELRRNGTDDDYLAGQAQQQAERDELQMTKYRHPSFLRRNTDIHLF